MRQDGNRKKIKEPKQNDLNLLNKCVEMGHGMGIIPGTLVQGIRIWFEKKRELLKQFLEGNMLEKQQEVFFRIQNKLLFYFYYVHCACCAHCQGHVLQGENILIFLIFARDGGYGKTIQL